MTKPTKLLHNNPIVQGLLKQKKILIGLVAVVIIGAGATGYLLYSQSAKNVPVQSADQGVIVPTLTPEQVGFTVTFRDDKNAVKFTLTNASDITNVEYTITYTAQVKGQTVNQGLNGTIDNSDGKNSVGLDKFREFGTCSSGVCRYDTVISPIMFTLKVTKKDGKTYSIQKSIVKDQS